jgi:molybdate transport system substrate-binding protein
MKKDGYITRFDILAILRMGVWRYLFLTVFLICISISACETDQQNSSLKIATAANMQYAMAEIVEAFEQKGEANVEVILSSSGKLTAQIKAGAPYDIFVSADTKYPAILAEEGFCVGEPVIYASGKLVLWSLSNPALALEDLETDTITNLAVPNPKTAPYGEAAFAFLKNIGMLDVVADKLVMGESIAQTNQFITTGAAQAGFTAYSVVLSPDWAGKGSFVLLDTLLYKSIDQSMILIQPKAKSQKPEANHAKSFFNFMQSKTAKTILRKYGYGTYE